MSELDVRTWELNFWAELLDNALKVCVISGRMPEDLDEFLDYHHFWKKDVTSSSHSPRIIESLENYARFKFKEFLFTSKDIGVHGQYPLADKVKNNDQGIRTLIAMRVQDPNIIFMYNPLLSKGEARSLLRASFNDWIRG